MLRHAHTNMLSDKVTAYLTVRAQILFSFSKVKGERAESAVGLPTQGDLEIY